MIPMCWKCSSAITKEDATGIGKAFAGCKENKNITSYGGAMVLCPLLRQPYEHKTVPLQISQAPPE